MELTPYPAFIPSFIAEYEALVESTPSDPSNEALVARLMVDSEWTRRGATTLVMLAREYGTFVLANALALAQALDIEDGDSGL